MSTHCTITIKLSNRKYKGIYCHFDGDTVIETLNKYWLDFNQINQLIDKYGDIESLGNNLNETISFNLHNNESYNCYEGDIISWSEMYNYIFVNEYKRWFPYKMYIKDINNPELCNNVTITFTYNLINKIDNIVFTSELLEGAIEIIKPIINIEEDYIEFQTYIKTCIEDFIKELHNLIFYDNEFTIKIQGYREIPC